MPTLEAQLTALTQEFVARLVDTIRNASFAEVASLSPARLGGSGNGRRPARTVVTQAVTQPQPQPPARRGGRQTAARRAEIGERVVSALRDASEPMGVRALSSRLGVAPDVLAVPLRELRAAGKVRKHGEKRSTTYSAA